MKIAKAALAALWLLTASPALAADSYAVVISGASGGDAYAQKYDAWRNKFVTLLREKFAYPDDRIFVLAEHEGEGVLSATREHVRQLFAGLRAKVGSDDTLLVLLIGHGTPAENDDAKFNLVGPDMTASEWAAMLKPIAGRLIFVNTSSASFPFIGKLSAPGRVVLTATDSMAQQFETVFPEFFVKAFDAPDADADKNGRVSIGEAFDYASANVRQWYEQRGQLPTEHALIDDNGDGVGREAQNPGADGALARLTYLQPLARGGDESRTALLKRQSDLEAAIDALKAKRESLSPEVYDMQLEQLLLELARVSGQLRSRQSSVTTGGSAGAS